MKLRVPHYYKDFTCIATDCKDNCCMGGWEIDIDDETAEYYLHLDGAFGDRLRNSITHTDEYCFRLHNGQCPFLDDKNLCEIYQVLGEDKMGVVCTQFPRFTEYFGEAKETGIGLACEEAARLILADRDSFHLEESSLAEDVLLDSELDRQLLTHMLVFREKCIKLLENSAFSIPVRLTTLLQVCASMQEFINHTDVVAMQAWVTTDFIQIATQISTHDTKKQRTHIHLQENMADVILSAYENLEVLNDDWKILFSHLCTHFFEQSMNEETYVENLHTFIKSTGYDTGDRLKELENICKYFCFRYMLKSVYDHNILAKAQVIVTHILLIFHMEMYRWYENGNQFSYQDRMDILHIFSREVEYSPDNLEEIAEEFLFGDCFDIDNLSQILLSL